MGPPRVCHVCNEAQSKYKCPSCLSPYCSLVCFKKHKETPCVKPVSSEAKSFNLPSAAGSVLLPEKSFQVDEPSEVLQKMQLESIVASSEVRDALKNEELQKLIYNIDFSTGAENELDKAMEMDVFRKFTDKLEEDDAAESLALMQEACFNALAASLILIWLGKSQCSNLSFVAVSNV
ncbi:hypothetical protein HHK36_012964 [Tetracentron sinense]|uniref:HIT-type domain-containing protein n=1 Tax=Tetracentron sinense TaxID=13715 RepID=A0A835DG18_TETSI|nr:hypothetical protein HHK36_012964 [Tetracentron sinense]